MTDKKKLYSSFSAWIAVSIVILWCCNPPLLIKAIICLNIFACVGIMRSVHDAADEPPNRVANVKEDSRPSHNVATSRAGDGTLKESEEISDSLSDEKI